MALTIMVRLRHGRYDAAYPADQAEWPPHPARLFCALVASAAQPDEDGHPADLTALRWLEQAGAPLVWAVPPQQVELSKRHGYAVTNATSASGGSTTWPGRTNGTQIRLGALPADDHLAFEWPEANADDAVLWRLSRMARRIPYLGRATSWAEVTVHDELIRDDREPAARGSWVAYRPVSIGTPGGIALRIPYPGYTELLGEAYERGEPAWLSSRTVAYRHDGAVVEPPAADPPAAGPYRELMIWPIRRGTVPIGGPRLLAITERLRQVVLCRVADPVPPQVSGHNAEGRPHVAYLGLLDVGHRYADGHLLGVAVAAPHDLAGADRAALLRGLLGDEADDPIRELRCGRDGLITLADPAEPAAAWGLRPERWTGPPEGARHWMTVTPVMLDRYPGRRDPGELIAESLVTAGYPEPESVTVLPAPPLPGALHLPGRGTLGPGRPRRPLLHCRVVFDVPVRGPVLAGALRYLGCGVLVPEVSHADRR